MLVSKLSYFNSEEMKKYIKTMMLQRRNNFVGISIIVASLVLPGCTKNFDKDNTNPTSLSSPQSVSIASTAFGPIEQAIFSNFQIAQNISADAFAGYMMSPTNFLGGQNNFDYVLVDTYNQAGFNDQYKLVMAPINKIIRAGARTASPDIYAVALLIQIEAMDRVTDRFGPIPYTKAGSSLTNIPYDDQQSVYQTFFKQLDTASTNLQTYIAANPGKNPIGASDLVFGGDYTKWLKYANSLRLRLAMRIVKADPATAQAQAVKAMSAPGGLLAVPADDAAVGQSGGRANDWYVVTIEYNGDNHLNAAIGTYLTGYNDPRTAVYAVPATNTQVAGKYVGIRTGCDVTKGDYHSLASYNCVNAFNLAPPFGQSIPFGQTSPQLIMTAAEMWFLKAEAAVRGWAGAGDAQTDYETGINTSMQQWGATAGSYISDATSTEAAYTDPLNPANNSPAVSSITVKWDPAATNEQKLERIITQKWLAIFPDGQEAWADFRRTGYPKLFTVAQNLSGGTIDTQTQIRRLAYPISEYNTNNAAVKAAVALLGGADNGGTRLWWDANKGNF
jgi:hypothetical protein